MSRPLSCRALETAQISSPRYLFALFDGIFVFNGNHIQGRFGEAF